MSTLGKQIRTLRTALGYDQFEFSLLLTVGESTLESWENDVSVPPNEKVHEILSLANRFVMIEDKEIMTELKILRLSVDKTNSLIAATISYLNLNNANPQINDYLLEIDHEWGFVKAKVKHILNFVNLKMAQLKNKGQFTENISILYEKSLCSIQAMEESINSNIKYITKRLNK